MGNDMNAPYVPTWTPNGSGVHWSGVRPAFFEPLKDSHLRLSRHRVLAVGIGRDLEAVVEEEQIVGAVG
eukprot:6587587-Prymnesium_polylepis.1